METVVFEQPITAIADYTFKDCVSLKSVTVGEGLKTIGNSAFNSSGLTEFVLPKSVEIIQNYAFQYCANLATFTIPQDAKLHTINNNAFDFSGLTSIKLPASLTLVGYTAFSNCPQLRLIEIAERTEVLRLYSGAFRNCTAATIYIPKLVTLPHSNTFDGWTAEQTIYVIGRTEADIMDDWYGTFTDDIVYGDDWSFGCKAKIEWNYKMP